jgi:phosphocarrier protein HPr
MPAVLRRQVVDAHQHRQVGGVEVGVPGLGTEVEIETSGEDEQAAMDALRALIDDKFGEGE